MRILLMPLDERPVNTALPRAIAALAGAALILPPRELLPTQRDGADTGALQAWLRDNVTDSDVDAVVLSLDMLVHGGLIASRTSPDPAHVVLERVDALRHLKTARPHLPVHVVSLIMRASNSYDAGEEPEYWATYGRELHAYGGHAHRRFLAGISGDSATASRQPSPVPADVLLDFERRRLRNHMVNLASLELASSGAVDTLVVTSDDTAVHSAGSVEQQWLEHWAAALPEGAPVSLYPGADEVGSILLARALNTGGTPVTFEIVCPDNAGLERIAPYENSPTGRMAQRQVAAAGAARVGSTGTSDVSLVIHPPDVSGFDWCRTDEMPADTRPVDQTVAAIRDAHEQGRRVALADVRYVNGADPVLVEALRREGLLLGLTAYGGWNTAGNSVGSVVAAAVAQVIATRRGHLDDDARMALLLTRLVEDYAYQAVLRTELQRGLGRSAGDVFDDPSEEAHVVARIEGALQKELDRLADSAGPWRITNVHLPWRRTFEIGFDLVRGA